MKSHTLMQAIARANRVFPGKTCGIIVDYVNVFKYMQKALTDYATGDDGSEYPAKEIDKLIAYIDGTIEETDIFLKSIGIDIGAIVAEASTFDRLDELRKAFDIIIANDEHKEKFKVMVNLMMNLYDAAKPEIFERDWENEKFSPLEYLHGLFHNTIDDEKVNRARLRMAKVLDGSVTTDSFTAYDGEGNAQYVIHRESVIDLSKIDVEALRKEIRKAEYKAIEIDDLKKYIEEALLQMLNRNCTRISFSQRYRNIIDRYNAGGSENEDYYEQLIKLIEELKVEDERANTEGLTEEELEIYDLLVAGKKLTKAEEQKVKLSAKNLFKKLIENRKNLLVVDWYKDEQPKEKVRTTIQKSLDEDLPESYDKESFNAKANLWYRWSCAVVDSAKFINNFEGMDDFRKFVDLFSYNTETRMALPLLISTKIRGVGFALACNFLKELGYLEYPKPDVHIKDVCYELGLSDDDQFSVFESIVKIADDNEVSPYKVDKIFWLICSGNYYKQDINVGRHKDEFISLMKEELLKH